MNSSVIAVIEDILQGSLVDRWHIGPTKRGALEGVVLDLTTLPVSTLLELHADLLLELRRREIVRSSDNPTGDYGELLFSRAFGWTLGTNATADADVMDEAGTRFQIKCRRLTAANPSRQLGFMRRLPDRPFDQLAAVLLDDRFRVRRAALIPFDTVLAGAQRVESVNAWRFMLRDSVWDIAGVVDVTPKLKEAQANL